MNKSLIIIPGGGDPNASHKDAYSLITTEANKRNYGDIELLTLIGHASHPQKGFLNLNKNVELLKGVIENYESLKNTYDIICRSYGCSVFFEYYRNKTDQFNYLGKAVLWGPSPYYVYYKVGKKNLKTFSKDGVPKGMIVNREIFDTMFPFEIHISEFRNDINLRIATGERDEYCSPYFLTFLKRQFKEKNIDYRKIRNVGHVVKKYNKNYLNALFDDFI